jgi:predicted nucleic acid-binding protein
VHYIDTNILIRYLAADHPEFSPRALAYFERLVQGKEHGIVLEGTLVEATQVLVSKQYPFERSAVAKSLMEILRIPTVRVANRSTHLLALEIFGAHRLDYLDCLHIATARLHGPIEILSFDRDFDRFDDIVRVEP